MSSVFRSAPRGTSLASPPGRAVQASRRHHVQFYDETIALLETVGRFVGSALGAGDAAIVVATEAHRAGLEQRLRASGLDVALAVQQGRYVPLDAAETLA